jgi:uncharacterized membrane protein YoaK (UPF0700 family)
MPWTTPLLLSLVAGYVDAASFVHFSGLLAAHITGNVVLFAVAIGVGLHRTDYLKLLSLPVFIVAVVATTWLHDRLPEAAGPRRSLWLLGAVSLSLIVIGIIGGLVPDLAPLHHALAMVLVAAMGVQNAVHRLYPGFGPATTVMTGNITQLTINTARRLSGWDTAHAHVAAAPWTTLRETLWLVGSFGAGRSAG